MAHQISHEEMGFDITAAACRKFRRDMAWKDTAQHLFEWSLSPDWILTVSINGQGRLAYSGLFGPNRIRGIEVFDARAQFTPAAARAIGLQLEADDHPPRHVGIHGWPKNKDNKLQLAQLLASKCKLYRNT
jgi:hypothetical protein